MPENRPNFICFVTDQQRADHLGCYGNRQVRTPNIDRLAAQGVRFTQSFVANPVCMPNRASMFTGRYPKAHGLRENGNTLNTSEAVLPELLRLAGYQTVSIGKIHLAPFFMDSGAARSENELYESAEYWRSHTSLPKPYYGFERVDLVDCHGPYVFGTYKNWLQKKYPGAFEKMDAANALLPPSGARECWKSAIPAELHYNTYIADRAIDFLRRRDCEKPFFLWCSFPDPHHPYCPPRPYCDMYRLDEIDFHPCRRQDELDSVPDYFRQSREGRIDTGGLTGGCDDITDEHYCEIIALTYGMITMVDDQVGRVIRAVEELGLKDDTIMVFLSDHGDLMGDHWLINKGPYLYRGLVQTPLIYTAPGGRRAVESSSIASSVDLCPTLLDFAGVDIPEGTQGESLKSVLTNGEHLDRAFAYIEYDESYINDRLRQIRSEKWALTAHANRREGLLFDLENDPGELFNLWDSPEHREIKSKLLAELYYQTVRNDDWLPPKRVHA